MFTTQKPVRRKSRLLIVGALSLSLFAGAQQPAAAAGGETVTTISMRITNGNIPWAFPPPDGLTSICPDIPAGLKINPDENATQRDQNAVITTRADGTKRIVVIDNTTVTAQDNKGGKYKVVYYNKATLDFDGKKVTSRMDDTIRIKGGKVDVDAAFDWEWVYPATAITVSLGADGIIVDPWPLGMTPWPASSADKLKEDPNIVPGSWVKHSTVGAPWACDPL